MIYVYISPDFATYTSKDNYTFRTILKIGYSKDETLSSRDSTYKTENPGRRLLYTIPGGSLQDETNIHKKFKHLLVYGNEWFMNSEEIHEFFKTHTTKESLRYLSNILNIKMSSRSVEDLYRSHKYTLNRFFIALNSILEYQDNSVIQYILETDKDSINVEECLFSWVCEVYPDIAPSIIFEYEYLVDLEKQYSEDIDRYRNTNFPERLKSFCEETKLSSLGRDKCIIADLISEKLGKYYNLVGPDRCKALGYNVTYIKQEIENKKVDPNRIREGFITDFSIGENIIRSEVKTRIKNLYQRLGLDKKAKATDLGKYFEIKDSKYKCSDGSWTHSIEILSLKKGG